MFYNTQMRYFANKNGDKATEETAAKDTTTATEEKKQ